MQTLIQEVQHFNKKLSYAGVRKEVEELEREEAEELVQIEMRRKEAKEMGEVAKVVEESEGGVEMRKKDESPLWP